MSMASTVTAERRHASIAARLADYLELTKPRIVVLELIVATAAACLAAPHSLQLTLVFHALWGTALVAASASIANQWWERDIDARMSRTANRPLPASRVSSIEAILLATATLVVGAGWLLWKVNVPTAVLGIVCWILYVLVYTPLKQRTPLNTAVGAVAGAIPLLMGWTATGAPLNLQVFALAGVLFLWQFPHFMAIAWMYRHEYAAAGHQMLPVVDPLGWRTATQAIVGASLLIPVSLIPALSSVGDGSFVYFVWALVLGLTQFAFAVRFALLRDETSARSLLRATLLYLPAWLAMLLIVTL